MNSAIQWIKFNYSVNEIQWITDFNSLNFWLNRTTWTYLVTKLYIFYKTYFFLTNFRCGKCGGWSFEKGAGICRIFTADACCGQLNKQRANKNFTSGYICNQCWTTRGQCPSYCSLKERQKNKCGTSHNTGAVSPQFTTPTGIGGVVPVPFNEDKCRCEKRMVGRGRFRRCRCIKPRCFDETLNPNGLCQDERRCRKRKVNFPRC